MAELQKLVAMRKCNGDERFLVPEMTRIGNISVALAFKISSSRAREQLRLALGMSLHTAHACTSGQYHHMDMERFLNDPDHFYVHRLLMPLMGAIWK